MAEITFTADPEADDILIDGVSLNDIDAFRSECLSGGAVSCDWNTLHTRLINHGISKMWWFLTESERRSIAEMAIKNTMFYQISYRGKGEQNCGGATGFFLDRDPCIPNSIIRYLKFKTSGFSNVDVCYWKRSETSEEFCYRSDQTYQLPCYMVDCFGDGFGHTMCSIQVAQGTDDLNNWIVFNYADFDIKPGDYQMPKGKKVYLNIPRTFTDCSGYTYRGSFAEFEV